MIKGGTSLKAAASVDCVVLDKTGTLTTGHPRVQHVIPGDPAIRPEEILALAASGEFHSLHPLALAIVRYSRDRDLMKIEQLTLLKEPDIAEQIR